MKRTIWLWFKFKTPTIYGWIVLTIIALTIGFVLLAANNRLPQGWNEGKSCLKESKGKPRELVKQYCLQYYDHPEIVK